MILTLCTMVKVIENPTIHNMFNPPLQWLFQLRFLCVCTTEKSQWRSWIWTVSHLPKLKSEEMWWTLQFPWWVNRGRGSLEEGKKTERKRLESLHYPICSLPTCLWLGNSIVVIGYRIVWWNPRQGRAGAWEMRERRGWIIREMESWKLRYSFKEK